MIKTIKKETPKKVITQAMLISELISMYPKLGEVLTFDYGFHCVGCFAAEMETLGEGAAVHGMKPGEIKEMVKTLNELAIADLK